ncbi:hypothetical protein Csa_023635, partial [Cucumis sativus]
ALIKEIDPTYDEHAYLDRSLEISRAESYVEGPPALTSHYVKYALAYTYVDLPLLLLMFTIFLLETTMNEFLDRMQSSFTAKLSAINELLMVLVKDKAVDSQQCYGGGEGLSFNASEVENRVDDVFMDVPTPNIDDQHVDDKTRTSISEDLGDGIVSR